MSDPVYLLSLAVALIFVIEGLFYAIFPDMVKRMMVVALQSDPQRLRYFGLGIAMLGAVLVWLIQQLH